MIDWQRMKELRDEIGPETFAEVMALFREEVEDGLTRLGEGSTPEGVLHSLRGSALNIGFTALGRLCAHGESRKEVPDLLPRLQATYQVSLNLLEGELERLQGSAA